MPLTRKLLEGMGLEEKQVETIIEAHVDVVNGLKAERDKLKEAADKLPDLQKQLEDAAKAAQDEGGWKAKYDEEREAFEAYKAEAEAKAADVAKAEAYRKLLADAGIDAKRIDTIMRVTDMKGVELDDEGGLKDVDNLKAKAVEEWADFVVKQKTEGTDPANPPKNEPQTDGADPAIAERIQQRHDRLYGKTDKE